MEVDKIDRRTHCCCLVEQLSPSLIGGCKVMYLFIWACDDLIFLKKYTFDFTTLISWVSRGVIFSWLDKNGYIQLVYTHIGTIISKYYCCSHYMKTVPESRLFLSTSLVSEAPKRLAKIVIILLIKVMLIRCHVVVFCHNTNITIFLHLHIFSSSFCVDIIRPYIHVMYIRYCCPKV